MESDTTAPASDLETRLRDALAPRYVLLRPIGKGGMGAVFLAREPELSRLVAVKVLAPELAQDETARARFIREAQAAAGIAHPNVIAVHSIGAMIDGTPYFVMQYATGESIASRLAREGPVNSPEARRMIGELASALAAAHARGIVHRDVKPANVLYDQETGRVLLTDFGIAAVRAMPGAGTVGPQLTGTGMMLGTPQYMSPEQLTAEPANDRTDVYGLGLVAYELLTGAGPFEVTSPMQMMAAHLRDVPKPLSERRPDVDPELEELVLACLAKEPNERPSSEDIVRRLGAAEVILEWPPPGLAPLHGALTSIARLFMVGGTIAAAAFLTLFGSGSSLAAGRLSLLMVLLIVATALGITILGVALWRLWRLARRVARATSQGYGWTTIAETLADATRDSGLLIAGLREYSSLTVDERDDLRRRRVIGALAEFAAGVVLVPLLVVFAWIAPTGASQSWIGALIALGPMAGLLALSLMAGRREAKRLRVARRRIAMRRAPDDVSDVLVATWRRTFDVARSGQRLGSGTTGHPGGARLAAVLLTIGTAGTLICLLPVFYVGVAGSSIWSNVATATVSAKIDVAEAARSLALAQDPSISPLEAGRDYYLAWLPPGPQTDAANGFIEQPTIGLPSLLPAMFPATIFTRSVNGPDGKPVNMRTGQIVGGPNPDGILAYAATGFTPEERKWLEQLDRSSRWAHWSRYARSVRGDLIGARFVVPFPDSLSNWEMPIPKFGAVKLMAYASVVRAALYRSRGEKARGDSVLRETISVGFRMEEDGSTLIEQLIGVVIIGIGHNALHEASVLDGRGDGKEWLARRALSATLQAQRDDSLAPVVSADLDARAMRRRIIATVLSTRLLRGIRLASYEALALAPCTNVRELIAGPDADVRDAMTRARPSLARFPSERALLDLMEHQPAVGVDYDAETGGKRWIMPVARISGWILRNPRIPGCVSALASGMWQ